MSGLIKDLRVSPAELYGTAAMLKVANLTQIPRSGAPDLEAPNKRGWTEEEFDGNIRVLPKIAKIIDLCANPEFYCEVSTHKANEHKEYRVYTVSGDALCLYVDGGEYIANLYDTAFLLDFFANEIPVGGSEDETVEMPQSAAAKRFAKAECVVRIAFADLTDASNKDDITARNWVAMYCDGVLWLINETEGVVLARPIDKETLRVELNAIFTMKGRG